MKDIHITEHALDRLREHWPDVRCQGDSKLIKAIKHRILDALKRGKKIITPGGLYVPITFAGRDGFAVLQDNTVTTCLPKEWCREINNIVNYF